jgi:hypothetical protein
MTKLGNRHPHRSPARRANDLHHLLWGRRNPRVHVADAGRLWRCFLCMSIMKLTQVTHRGLNFRSTPSISNVPTLTSSFAKKWFALA